MDAPTGSLVGLWGLERVSVAGMAVPLPKQFRVKLHFQPGGKLVVHGVRGTTAKRSEGTWRTSGPRLFSEVAGKKEVRTFVLRGKRLTLTLLGLRRTVWHMKRMAAPSK